jgi:hypothetical protein
MAKRCEHSWVRLCEPRTEAGRIKAGLSLLTQYYTCERCGRLAKPHPRRARMIVWNFPEVEAGIRKRAAELLAEEG